MKTNPKTKWMISTIIVLMLGLLAQIILPWPGIYSWTEEIGLDSGRKRSCTNILWISTLSKESPTWLSDTLNTPDSLRETRWKPVNTTSPAVSVSPHYRYHGALSQIGEIELICEEFSLSANSRELLAKALIERWRSDGYYHGASTFLISPLVKQFDKYAKGRPMPDSAVKDLVGGVK